MQFRARKLRALHTQCNGLSGFHYSRSCFTPANLGNLGSLDHRLDLYFLVAQAAPGLQELQEMLPKPLREHPFHLATPVCQKCHQIQVLPLNHGCREPRALRGGQGNLYQVGLRSMRLHHKNTGIRVVNQTLLLTWWSRLTTCTLISPLSFLSSYSRLTLESLFTRGPCK